MAQEAVWLSPSFKHSVIGGSLASQQAPPPVPPAGVPLDAFRLISRQLELLANGWPALPAGVRRGAGLGGRDLRGARRVDG